MNQLAPRPRTLGASRRSLLAAFRRARSDLDSLVIRDLPERQEQVLRALMGEKLAADIDPTDHLFNATEEGWRNPK